MPIQYKNAEWNSKKVIIGETELDREGPVNLLIGFHGADSTPENMLIHGNRLKVHNTVLIFPEGPVDAGKGLWSWWTDGPRQEVTVQGFLDYTKGIIDQALDYIIPKVPENRIRTCLWGFSQGGAASLVYALMGSHPIHKVASICGFLPEISAPKNPPQKPATILGVYGLNDEVVPAFLAEYALDEMKNQGHPLTVRETDQGHEVKSKNLQEVSDFFNV